VGWGLRQRSKGLGGAGVACLGCLVRREAFLNFWDETRLLTADMATRVFHALRQPGQNVLTQVPKIPQTSEPAFLQIVLTQVPNPHNPRACLPIETAPPPAGIWDPRT